MTEHNTMPTQLKTGAASTAAMRKPYSRPSLVVFGAVRQFTQGSSGGNSDAGANKADKPKSTSSVAYKQDCVQIGRHPLGFGVYLFNYRPEFQAMFGQGRQFGLMAEEVQRVVPAAVECGADGYIRVDYAMLGVAPMMHAVH